MQIGEQSKKAAPTQEIAHLFRVLGLPQPIPVGQLSGS
jgi:hypothetical protein